VPEQMGNKPAGTEAIRIWSSWFLLWVVWVISTTLGWVLAGMLTLGMAFAFAIPDPDAAQAYVSSPLGERIFDGLMLGAMVGLIPALLIALFWVVLRRSARDVVWAVLATIMGSALLCVAGRGGGPQIESSMRHAVRSKRPPDLSPYTYTPTSRTPANGSRAAE
jgi:predicted branched-subunit amino acid permease